MCVCVCLGRLDAENNRTDDYGIPGWLAPSAYIYKLSVHSKFSANIDVIRIVLWS